MGPAVSIFSPCVRIPFPLDDMYIHIYGRESARVRGKTPEGLPMEDPEEAFLKRKQREGAGEAAVTSRTKARLLGDVSMAASNASADGTLRLRQV